VAAHGLIKLRSLPQDVAQLIVGSDQVRLESDGLPVTGLCLIQLSLLHQGTAQVAVKRGVFRMEVQRLPIAGLGLAELTESPMDFAEITVICHSRWNQGDRATDVIDRRAVLPELMSQYAEKVPGIRVFGIGLQNL